MTLACLFTLALPEASQDPFFYLYAPDAMGSHSASMSCLRCSLPDKTRLVCARCLGESHSLYELPEMQFQRRDTGRDIYDRGSCRSAQSRPLSEPPLAHLHPSIVAQLLWWGFSRLRIIISSVCTVDQVLLMRFTDVKAVTFRQQ